MAVQATISQYVPASTTSTLHTGVGQILGIIATTTSATPVTITFYDETSGAGDVLLALNLQASAPVFVQFQPTHRLKFTTGLTVVTPANTTCHVTINTIS